LECINSGFQIVDRVFHNIYQNCVEDVVIEFGEGGVDPNLITTQRVIPRLGFLYPPVSSRGFGSLWQVLNLGEIVAKLLILQSFFIASSK